MVLWKRQLPEAWINGGGPLIEGSVEREKRRKRARYSPASWSVGALTAASVVRAQPSVDARCRVASLLKR